jgi:hypothetical protein
MFLNSCAVGIDLILVEVQMKETELHKNDTLKDAFTEGNYSGFMVAHPKVPSASNLQRRKRHSAAHLPPSIFVCEL